MNRLAQHFSGTARTWLCIAAATLIPGLSWAAGACIAPEGGIAGTGAPIENGGVGGTGAPRPLENGGVGGTGSPQPAHGGVGGTGQRAEGGVGGTGIVGIVTGFASVCVNGLEVHYERTTPTDRNGLTVAPDQLALGQVVAIEAAGSNVSLHARRITILEAVAGPITHLDAGTGLVQVMGQTVRITGETRLAGAAGIDDLTVGTPLHVSGYRDAADQIIASRVEVDRAMTDVSVMGFSAGTTGQDKVGGVAVSLPPTAPPTGGEVLVRGTWDGRRLQAASVRPDPTLPFFGRVDKVVLEGLVLEHRGAGQLRISGFDVRYSTATGIAGGSMGQTDQGQRLRVTGRLGAGRRLEAEYIELMPEGIGWHGARTEASAARGAAAAGSPPSAIGTMAPALGLPQRMLPIIRPSQGISTPSRGMGR
ncbi:MAG: DUF5666 domain-containing protein [Rhodocyclaceae bacterium]|nr:DUF5666 domain-containing protein [Rhodocyclaceae bacterium]